ncbi:hypothetical protein GON03_22555 [Nocardioides sp. MAH-18]|uniref:Lipoprotein n=1 Tax=Nocardioides agri TaxID=2682843 RepID=A0A6L6XX38_9ACTN|nr:MULTISPECIES: hypothetical protein [unclassified Nocardioides]MBA2952809.1 hypothetical protein [Nocardioides sp. CGMCC 1.13656]MVQ51971.1 hypothetical protein [Nocardioides sp. MAH-18]
MRCAAWIAAALLLTACGTAEPATTETGPTASGTGAAPPSETATAAAPDQERVARAFVAFARGDRDRPPADTPVELYLGGHRTRTLTSSGLGDRQAWETCPEGGHFAGRVCPGSALEVLRQHAGAVALAARPPTNSCVPAAQTLAAATVNLTPTGVTSCLDYWLVQLVVDDGQVTAVNLVQFEP